MKKSAFLFAVCLLGMYHAHAQGYVTAAGLRLGNTWGLTVSQLVMPRTTVEFILDNDYRDHSYFHLLARRHVNLATRKVNVFYGAGLHGGTNSYERKSLYGVEGQVGVEATIGKVNVAFDFKPQLSFGGGATLGVGFVPATALSARYVLINRKAMPIRKPSRKPGRPEFPWKTGN
jgi:hypothetical protein